MTNRILDFMQEAVAFIYIICTPAAGGVKEDRVQFSFTKVILMNAVLLQLCIAA